MRRLLLLALIAAALGCATPRELGERRYREGDRLAALEIWRSVPPSSSGYETVNARIHEVEREFAQLVKRYRKRGRYFEDKERLAESILNYRLSLKLRPDDHETLDHVQELARRLAVRKQETYTAFKDSFASGELAMARDHLTHLRELDPFDPKLENDQRQLGDALEAQVESGLARGRRGFSSGNLAAAATAFRAVLDLDPGNETARGYLSYIASIRRTQGRGLGVTEPPEIFASDADIDAEGFYQNALAAEKAGDPYSAIAYDLQALRQRPSHPDVEQHLAELRERLRPRVAQLLESGRSAFQQEDLQTAVDLWRRALLIDPQNARARDYLNRAQRLLRGLEQLRADDGDADGRR